MQRSSSPIHLMLRALALAVGLILPVLPALAAEPETPPTAETAATEAAAATTPAIEYTNTDCLDCHTDATLTKTLGGKEVPMAAVDTNLFTRSVHGALNCTDCHVGVKPDHEPGLPRATCGDCHEQAAKEYTTSIHGVSHQLGTSGAAGCGDCHGNHYMTPVKHPDSPVFKLNLPRTCAQCHSNSNLTEQYHLRAPEAASHYLDSIHGRALLKMGLIVAPSCND